MMNKILITSVVTVIFLITHSNYVEGQFPFSSSNILDLQSKIPLIDVEYQTDSMIVLRADENTLLQVNGTMVPFWTAIEIVKQNGYTLNEVTTSGMGSQGNPTRFYAIMTK